MTILGVTASSISKAVPNSFDSIATANPANNATSVTFSNIPGTYKHLQIRAFWQHNGASPSEASLQLYFNNDTTTAYSRHQIYAYGGTLATGSNGDASATRLNGNTAVASTANFYAVSIIDIFDYADTTKATSTRAFGGQPNNNATDNFGVIQMRSGAWNSTSTVTRIDLDIQLSNTFKSFSRIALYGIEV